ncbi:acyl carrier protein [Schaalia sp. 19OD2882]|uniref:acyl carrier protein n=1 Tax=Schaalia sp. 19OD2882 TaxID=2794089 RepID=UPI001C1ED919|nr:acyl carrier protein [Schaalia sp. 19OD2882]QWW18798.1 acyl carrier protein [Schaalia sp. 19OD2882]
MGTIADLLGYSLSQEPPANSAAETEPGGSDAQESARALLAGVTDEDARTRAERARESVMTAVLEHTDLDPQEAREDLALATDLDLDTLGLYAIVSMVEHETGSSFPDEQIRQWRTLGDLLAAATPD